MQPRDAQRVRVWLAVAGIWTVLAVLSGTQTALFLLRSGRSIDYVWVYSRALWSWYSCALFTPAIFWLCRRVPLDRAPHGRAFLLHLAATIVFGVIKVALYVPIARAMRLIPVGVSIRSELIGEAFSIVLVYWTIAAVAHAYDYYERYRERELQASRLETQLVQLRLDALKTQLQPHFLFNALNALSMLIHKDAAAADRMVIQIGEMLRQSLDRSAPQEVTLQEELETVNRYLSIMHIRLGERMRVSFDVDDAVLAAFVPNLLLQPLVENAVKHGIAQSIDSGRIAVRAQRRQDRLVIEVSDDGAGPPRTLTHGVGLSNTTARLHQLYGDDCGFELLNANGRGALARVVLPFHTEPLSFAAASGA